MHERRLERIRVVHDSLQINKGALIENFDYNSKFKVTKTGKEVKDKLAFYKISLLVEVANTQAKLEILSASLPKEVLATEEPSSYVFEGIRKEAFDSYPKMFSYKQMRPYESKMESEEKYPPIDSVRGEGGLGVTSDCIYTKMSDYNSLARKIISIKADILWLDEVCGSMKDSQKIEMDTRMLKLLI